MTTIDLGDYYPGFKEFNIEIPRNAILEGDVVIGDAASDTLTLTATMASKIPLMLNGGAASASGLLMGVGTSGSPATTAVNGAKFVELRCETTDTSDDNRLMYLRYAISGIAGGGECIRAFAKVGVAAATVRGAHISIDLSSTGSCSGLGAGVDAQVMLGDVSYSDRLTAVNADIYSAGTSTDISGVVSFIRCVMSGNATGLAAVEDAVNFCSIQGGTVASGNLIQADDDETKFSHKMRMEANGTTYYIMLSES